MKKFNRYYVILILFIIAYAVAVLKLPVDNSATNARYGLTNRSAQILSMTILVPLVVIWWSAFMGFVKVKQYAAAVGQSKDGRALKVLGDGLMLLAFSLPINSILNTLRTYITNQNPSLTPSATIAYNYVSLAFTLAGIWLVAFGARKLAGTLEKKPYTLNQAILASAFTAFCIFYTYITLTDPVREVGGGITGRAAYYLPDFLVLGTIVIPYIFLWFLGFRAAYHIQLYRLNVPGILYRKALGYLAAGIAFVVVSLMVLRLTTSMTSFLGELSLKYLLAFVYFLLILIGVGYVLIARGARRLKKIEEV